MIDPLISYKSSDRTVTVFVKVTDLDAPKSPAEMSSFLTRHLVDCHDCLCALCQSLDLDRLENNACSEYDSMLTKMRADLRRRESLIAGGHVSEELLEEYCFNRLPEEETEVLENHLADCPRCLNAMQQRSEFISEVKAAIALQREQSAEIDGLLGISCPDLDFAITGPLKL